nr:oligosaccharide flippase family protein [uncultured Blautia sp.]
MPYKISMQKSLAKNSIYNIIYTVVNILFPFVTSIYVSRILLPVGVGKVSSAQNIASYFVTIAALGLPSYGVREFAKVRENEHEKNKIFTELLLLNVISTTLAVGGFFILVFANAAFSGEWALYGACGLAVFFNYLNIDWMYKGLEEYGYITGRSLLIKGLSLGALFLFVKTRQDYVLYALISSLATGGNYIFNVIHAKKFVRIEFSGIHLKKHIKPVLFIACIIFLSSIYNKIDVTMLNMMATDESVGYYAYALKTVNMVLTMANAVTAALLPRLSFYYENDRGGFYRLLDKGFQILCFMTLPLAVGMTLVASQTVEFLYGEAFGPAALTIQLMCPLILIKGFGDLFCYQLVYSTKSEKIILPAAASASVINIITNSALIPPLLQNGAVIASVFSELATNTIQFIYMKKKVRFSINGKALAEGLLSTAIMAACVCLLMQINLPNMVGLMVEVACGAIVYVAVNLMMKNAFMIEILEKVKVKLLHRA